MTSLQELLRQYLRLKNLGAFEDQLNFFFALIGLFSFSFAAIYKITLRIREHQRKKRLTRDLSPFYTPNEIENSLKYYVPTKCQNVSPSIVQEPANSYPFATKEKLIPFFLRKAFKDKYNDCKFFIILADSGMGKTTFMINLFLSYTKKSFFHSIFGDLFWTDRFKMRLYPLGHPKTTDEISSLESKTDTILLLDAFDEDSNAIVDFKKRLAQILDLVWKFRMVIITCRTHFFPTEQEEPEKTGLLKYGTNKGEHIFGKLYISPFDDSDIKKYLRRKYPWFSFRIRMRGNNIPDTPFRISYPVFLSTKRGKAQYIVSQSPNLMVRPMLLNYIDELIKNNTVYRFSFQIYEELIDKWLEREALRYNDKDVSKAVLYKFSFELAKDIFLNREKRKGLYISVSDLEIFAKKYNITLSRVEMTSKSLLNRTAEGLYKFSHKSILEYFLAMEGYNSPKFIKDNYFNDLDNVKLFLKEIGIFKSIQTFFIKYPSFRLFACKSDGGIFEFHFRDITTNLIDHIVYIYFDEKYLKVPELKQFVISFSALKMFSDDKTDMPTFSVYYQQVINEIDRLKDEIKRLAPFRHLGNLALERKEYYRLETKLHDLEAQKDKYESRFEKYLEFDKKLRSVLDED